MNYLEQIKKLVQEKLESETPEQRLEKLNAELKKEKPDFPFIKSLIDLGVGKKMTMEKVQIQFEKEKDKKETKKRLELFNKEMKKFVPDISLLESLLKQGIGKKVDLEEVKVKIRENKDRNLPKEFEEFVSKGLETDGVGMIDDEDMEKLKQFLSQKDIKLPVDTFTSEGPSLIHIAVGMGDVELAQMLIDRGANLDSHGKTGGWSNPLDWDNDDCPNMEGFHRVKEMIEEELNEK
jgi:hypothetical protein